MKLIKPAKAGSMESNDILVQLYPAEELTIELHSPVKAQFGDRIEEVIRQTLQEMEAGPVRVIANDRGALDFAIRARVKSAVKRGTEL